MGGGVKLALLLLAGTMFPSVLWAQEANEALHYNEAFEESSGQILGEVSTVTALGPDWPMYYTIEADGYYRLVDSLTNSTMMHGLVQEGGTLEASDPAQPRPPAKPPAQRPGRGGRLAAVCLLGEEAAGLRCEIRCRANGVSSINHGTCGFGSTCACNEPPPPPPAPPPGTRGGGFTPPWLSIVGFWDDIDQCGMFRVCDDRSPY